MTDSKFTQRSVHRTWLVAISTVCMLQPIQAFAACQITSVSDVSFGTYDVFSTAPNNNGVGSLSIRCSSGSSAIVKLSHGRSNTFAARALHNGSNELSYNLYTSAARNIVWGDGSGGTSVMSVGRNHSDHLDVFGSIPEGQDVPVGMYTDDIVVTVNF
jgi:spore coat protein U-like protein